MSDQPDTIVLMDLRRLDETVGGLRGDVREVKERLGILEAQYASRSRRVDRMGGDLELIERRLDAVETPAG